MSQAVHVRGALALFAGLTVASCQLLPGSDAQRIARFKRDVSAEAGRDVEFQKVWVVDGVVCGEIGAYDTKNAFQIGDERPRIEPAVGVDIASLNDFSDFADEFLARCHPDYKRSVPVTPAG
jgi:hypothetical protein